MVFQDRAIRLVLSDSSADKLFENALRQLASEFDSRAVRSIPIRATADQPATIVHLVPIRGVAHDVFSTAAAIVVATPVVPGAAPQPALVQGLYDLTPAEARIASLVASGQAPRDAARSLGITEETARTTLKRVFAKVGVSRQSELAALLARLTLG
jgi:DNA-binding CsgD family transcriptional regulator